MTEIIKIIAQDGNGTGWIDLLIPLVFVVIFIIGNIAKMKNKQSLKDYEEDDKGEDLTDLPDRRYKPLGEDTSRHDRVSQNKNALPYAKYHKSSSQTDQQRSQSQQEQKRRHQQLIEQKRRQLQLQRQKQQQLKEQQQRQRQAQILRQKRQQAREQHRTQAQKQDAYQQRISRTAEKMREKIEERVDRYQGRAESKQPVRRSKAKMQKMKSAPRPLTKAPVLGEKRKAEKKGDARPLTMQSNALGSVIGQIKKPQNIRKAVIYSEILGMPKALKGDSLNLWDQ
jgi:hypothetical protein